MMTEDEIIEAKYINSLPLFVSIPRSGCNWLQPVLEVYFGRHRVMKHPNSPSWMEGDPNENPLWMHAHDNFHDKLDIKTDKPVVFLYRNPTDVIYSMTSLLGGNQQKIEEWCGRYQRCYDKWASANSHGHGTGLVHLLRYEDLLNNPVISIKGIHELWKDYHDLGEEFDIERAEMALKTVGDKQSVNKKNGSNQNFKNPHSHKKAYEMDRDAFRERFGADISRMVKML